ncbi:MAG: P-type DNA transfer ATPase VirB11 [Brevundimonas sp.]|uniref:P-type DNA transfer ATPase VirB11 n=1 Tax=Brevundimonas sp. TaxID=1871086 RepID=UPI002488F38C|nr:P-type DNA transfer ATPase VirB11 [Brevundimonas sp.]MDI1325565.1 P-type DNA transfer ATPase VirB11 [Brevundimonas sp.]
MTDVLREGQVYLQSYLAPFAGILARADVTDIYVNAPDECWAETLGGGIECHRIPGLDETALARLARQIAAYAHQGISREHPILSAALPGGERVQIIIPPATRGGIVLAIRKHVSSDLRLEDYVASGAFETAHLDGPRRETELDAQLRERLKTGDVAGLLSIAVTGRRNILISGGTSTGKTTFLNALIQEVPQEERLIFIEDTPELHLHHPNAVGLIAPRSALGEALVTAEDLLNASLRMRPDRIILGELRGPEAYTFLRAVNTGHPGSMTTVHADSPDRAIEQIALLVLQGGTTLRREDVVHYIRSTIDVFVQLSRSAGRRSVSEIALRTGP